MGKLIISYVLNHIRGNHNRFCSVKCSNLHKATIVITFIAFNNDSEKAWWHNVISLKGQSQAKIIQKSVILFWLPNMAIWCEHVHRLELRKFFLNFCAAHSPVRLDIETKFLILDNHLKNKKYGNYQHLSFCQFLVFSSHRKPTTSLTDHALDAFLVVILNFRPFEHFKINNKLGSSSHTIHPTIMHHSANLCVFSQKTNSQVAY